MNDDGEFLRPGEAMELLPLEYESEGHRRRDFEKLRQGLADQDRRLIGSAEHVRLLAWRRVIRTIRRRIARMKSAPLPTGNLDIAKND